jgi:hypothetical protein
MESKVLNMFRRDGPTSEQDKELELLIPGISTVVMLMNLSVTNLPQYLHNLQNLQK